MMAINSIAAVVLMSISATATAAPEAARPPPPNPCSSPQCAALQAQYTALKNATCGKVLLSVPALNAADEAAFTTLYKAYNGTNEGELMMAAQKLLSTPSVSEFLSAPDTFATPDGLDAEMVKCAVLFQATPTGLALFAQVSSVCPRANGTACVFLRASGAACVCRRGYVHGCAPFMGLCV
jgi:hypothetical protein